MNILFVCEHYAPHPGGVEFLFKNLAERYVQQGHQVTVVTRLLKGTRRKEMVNGVQLVRVPSCNSRYAFSFAAIPTVLRLAKRHDVIQTTSFNGAPPAWLAGKVRRKPVLITVHEIWVGKWKHITGFSVLKSWFHELLERMIYFLPYDHYVCISEATKKDLLQLNIPKQKVHTIPNGCDDPTWKKSRESEKKARLLRRNLRLEKKIVFFSWGRPGLSKGFETVLKAAPELQKRIPSAKIILMLNGKKQYPDKYNELAQLAHRLGKENVLLVPPTSREELKAYLLMADCAIIPSLAEGFGYTTVEACLLQTPVIISNAGSLPEVVFGKHRIFQKKNVADLLKNMQLAVQGKWDITPKKTFAWETTTRKYLDLYRETLNLTLNLTRNEARG